MAKESRVRVSKRNLERLQDLRKKIKHMKKHDELDDPDMWTSSNNTVTNDAIIAEALRRLENEGIQPDHT